MSHLPTLLKSLLETSKFYQFKQLNTIFFFFCLAHGKSKETWKTVFFSSKKFLFPAPRCIGKKMQPDDMVKSLKGLEEEPLEGCLITKWAQIWVENRQRIRLLL